MTNHEPSKGAMTAALQLYKDLYGESSDKVAVKNIGPVRHIHWARIIDRHMQTERESVKELVDTLREVQNAYLMATPETVRDFDWILWNERADAILKRIKDEGDGSH